VLFAGTRVLSSPRCVSEDPLGFGSDSNFYAYARHAPTNLTDPTGEILPLLGCLAWNYLRCVAACSVIDLAGQALLDPCNIDVGGTIKQCLTDCIWDMLPIPNPCGRIGRWIGTAIGTTWKSAARIPSSSAKMRWWRIMPMATPRRALLPNMHMTFFEKTTQAVAKTGVSGGNILSCGRSKRANRQASKLNEAAGFAKYDSRVVAQSVPGSTRRDILDFEKQRADFHRDNGEPMGQHKYP